MQMRFNKNLYSKVALLKAAYNYTDKAYLHLDADMNYYYVNIESKDKNHEITAQELKMKCWHKVSGMRFTYRLKISENLCWPGRWQQVL